MLTDKEIERMIEGDKDYSDLSMLIIPLPMVIFIITIIITKLM